MRILAPLRRRRPVDGAAAYLEAAIPPPRTHWREASWCALDFELTGLDPRRDEIISFGAVPVEDGRVQLRDAVHQLIRPAGEISDRAVRVHGIRAADLVRAPSLERALGSLLEAIAGRILIVHTASIEHAFLGRVLRDARLRLRGPMIDIEVLGRLWLLERDGELWGRVGLAQLARALGLPAERPHDALGDALTTAQVFIALCAHLDALGSETVGSLEQAPVRLDLLRGAGCR